MSPKIPSLKAVTLVITPGIAPFTAPAAALAFVLVFGTLSLVGPSSAVAGPGHDHGDSAPAAASADSPQRLPDGALFVPKPSQRRMGVRTSPVAAGELPRAVELSGRVIADPAASGRVQPTQSGRIEPGPRGIPSPGQRVARGEVLAWVRPAIGTVERGNQEATLADLRANRELAVRRLERLESLRETVARREIDQVRAELQSFDDRLKLVSAALGRAEALIAPVTGVVAAVNAVAGQVVDARELVFEIVDPARLRVEALAYDAALAADIAAASVILGDGGVALDYLGAGPVLREQAQPLLFRARPMPAQGAGKESRAVLAVGMPVRIAVQTRSKVKGYAVPLSAVVRNASNQDVVWVKAGPERFVPHGVRIAPLDAARVAVLDGLDAGDRVVTEAAQLLNQVR